jgi:hypothetical protein
MTAYYIAMCGKYWYDFCAIFGSEECYERHNPIPTGDMDVRGDVTIHTKDVFPL